MKIYRSNLSAAAIIALAFAFAFAFAVFFPSGANAAVFTEENKVRNQEVTGISIGLECRYDGDRVPNTMFTVEPHDSVAVLSTPADLVKVATEDGMVKLSWNDFAFVVEGGVQIGFPADRLTFVEVHTGSSAQILDGFTAVEKLTVNQQSAVSAEFTGLTGIEKLELDVRGKSTADVKSNVAVEGAFLAESTVNVEAPSVGVNVEGMFTTVGVSGDVSTGNVTRSSVLYVSGNVEESLALSGGSKVIVRDDVLCDKVSGTGDGWFDSTCRVGDEANVAVTTAERPRTMTGTYPCCRWPGWTYSYADGDCYGSFISGGKAKYSSRAAIIAALTAGVAAGIVSFAM